ncbi:hypothetical protein GW17_00049981 [Ensete ventricosum]|nr:hypothetical protein GW17_00049981 [Ensete ventricosum]
MISRTCPSITTMTEIKPSSSVTVKESPLLLLVPQCLLHTPLLLHDDVLYAP